MRSILLTCLSFISTLIYAGGEWITDSESGCKLWNSDPERNELSYYRGKCVNGKAQGKCTTGWSNDETISYTQLYIGEYKNGVENGEGTLQEFDNEARTTRFYKGKFKNGRKHGNGTYQIHEKGQIVLQYEGYFEDDEINSGKLIYYNDEKQTKQYDGDFNIEYAPHGEGTEIDTKGNKYTGSFQNGKKHGKGEFTSPDGNSYKGLWENGVRIKIF